MSAVLADGRRVTPDGSIRLYIGGNQPDLRSLSLTGKPCITIDLK